MVSSSSTIRPGRKPSILTRPRRKTADLPMPAPDPFLGDRSPEWAVYYFRTLKPAEFAARYGVQRKVRVQLEDGSSSERFLARRPNLLCVKSADTIIPVADEQRLLQMLTDTFPA